MDPESHDLLRASDLDARPLEVAHVLFMDVVSYSLLPMDQQSEVILQLQDIVRRLPEYEQAQRAGELISLPAGDGMALAFFCDLTAPVRCARKIALTIKTDPRFQLRMGIHSGPVFRVADINTSRNVAGGGINFAQRVMDCGDGGHILISKTTADMLVQLSTWKDAIHDLGEIEVKHGARIHIFNVFTEEFGNSQVPSKLRLAKASEHVRETEDRTPVTVVDSAPPLTLLQPSPSRWPRWLAASIIAFGVVCATAFFAYQKFGWFAFGPTPGSQSASNTQPAGAPPPKPAPPAVSVAPSNPTIAAAPETSPLAFSSAAPRNWKDHAEYELYSAIVKDTNPKTRLESLDQWEQLYPASEFLKERRALQLNTYAALGKAQESVNLSQQILAEDPKNFAALYYTVSFIRQLAGSPQFTDFLDRSENAASVILSNIELPPPNFSQEQWKTSRPTVEKLVHTTLGWIAMQRKKWGTAESELLLSLGIDPNNAEADYWLGSAIVSERRPEKQSQGLYYFARAAAYEGPGALPADGRARLLAYVREQYKGYHGSETGVDDLLKQAAREPSPPSDFKIMSTREIAEENGKREAAGQSPATGSNNEGAAPGGERTATGGEDPEANLRSDQLASPVSAQAAVSRAEPPRDVRSALARGIAFYNIKNYAAALPLLRQAADSGDGQAMTLVGWMYQSGWGVSQDYVEAVTWFRKGAGANPGNPSSMAAIGQLYLSGKGVKKDYGDAMSWFRKAADGGSSFAMWKVGILCQNGWGVRKDYKEALSWYTKAADAREVRAMGSIGLLYQQGHGVHRDLGQAMLWYQKGAAVGNRDDMRRIGFLYEYGWGVRKDYVEAMRWYQKASVAGDYIAMLNIGNMYEHGSGVKKDKDQAISWYRKSAAAGSTQAKDDLRRLHAQP